MGTPDPVDPLNVMEPAEVSAIFNEIELRVEAGDDAEPSQPWAIPDIGAADWAMRKLVAAQTARAAYLAQAAEWQRIAEAFNHTIDFFTDRLAEWGIAQRDVIDMKTIKLPTGSIATRENKPRVVVDNADVLLEWARTNAPDAIKIVESVLISKLPTAIANDGTVVDPESGEIIPGVGVDPGGITATVKPIANEL